MQTTKSRNLVIREAQQSELPAMADLTNEVYSQFATSGDPAFWSRHRASTRRTIIEDEGIIRLICVVDGELAGAVVLCPSYEFTVGASSFRNPHWEMRLLAVSDDFRNLGIAGKLITACEERILSLGESILTLHTTDLMQTAMAMYERRGYERYQDIDFEPFAGFTIYGFKKEFATDSAAE